MRLLLPAGHRANIRASNSSWCACLLTHVQKRHKLFYKCVRRHKTRLLPQLGASDGVHYEQGWQLVQMVLHHQLTTHS
jgi:hypothetical protein